MTSPIARVRIGPSKAPKKDQHDLLKLKFKLEQKFNQSAAHLLPWSGAA